MSDQQEESPAKAFAWLFGGLIALFIVLIFLGVLIASSIGPDEQVQKQRRAEIDMRLQPVAQVNTNPNATQTASLSSAGKASKAPMSGKQVYSNVCSTCHGSGTLGAPKFASKTQWTPHAKKGLNTLFDHALHGFKKMPAKGGNSSLSDKEVKNGVTYMLKQAKAYELAQKK